MQFQVICNNINHTVDFKSMEEALQHGVRWIQLRIKEENKKVVEKFAMQTRMLCDLYNAVFILNDYPDIAIETGANGVHVGRKDIHAKKIREKYGDILLIGSSANTFDDVLEVHQYSNYIGLGPLRYTSTKKNISPVLGVEGYKTIIEKIKTQGIQIPVVAIGGIIPADVKEILQTGCHGFAVSSSVFSGEISRNVHQFLTELANYRMNFEKTTRYA